MPPQEQVTIQDMSRQQQDVSRYTLSLEEASSLFIQAGVPRSPRTITRYCTQGHLECVKIDTERNEKYMVSQESVNARIEELKQVPVSSYVQTQRDMSGHVKTSPDMSGHVQTQTKEPPTKESEEKIRTLEAENFDLKITNRAKDMFIDQLKTEREGFITKLTTFSQRIGELRTKLLQLTAPKDDSPRRVSEPQDAEFLEIEEQPQEESENVAIVEEQQRSR